MKDWKDWSAKLDPHFAQRSIIAFDLDDTLTEKGRLPAEVITRLEAAQSLGWTTVLVTGRPAGWADALIKLLPFDAIVAENGALLFYWPKGKERRAPREECRKEYWTPEAYGIAPPAGLQDRFREAERAILNAVPRTRVASDQKYRIYDLAIDFAEEVDPPLTLSEAAKIQALFESLGAVAKVSSIHVNGWWGAFSKIEGLRELVEKRWQKSIRQNLIYVGDSPNDGPLFASEALSVGVANIRAFAAQGGFALPQSVTQGEAAAGSLEILERLNAVESSARLAPPGGRSSI